MLDQPARDMFGGAVCVFVDGLPGRGIPRFLHNRGLLAMPLHPIPAKLLNPGDPLRPELLGPVSPVSLHFQPLPHPSLLPLPAPAHSPVPLPDPVRVSPKLRPAAQLLQRQPHVPDDRLRLAANPGLKEHEAGRQRFPGPHFLQQPGQQEPARWHLQLQPRV